MIFASKENTFGKIWLPNCLLWLKVNIHLLNVKYTGNKEESCYHPVAEDRILSSPCFNVASPGEYLILPTILSIPGGV